MIDSLPRRVAFRVLRWWRDMVNDLIIAEDAVTSTAHKIHIIAGRTHVIEYEAYGDTKPRRTLPPPTSCK